MNYKITKNVKNKHAPAMLENTEELIKNKKDVDELLKVAKKSGEVCLKFKKSVLEQFFITLNTENLIITYGGRIIE